LGSESIAAWITGAKEEEKEEEKEKKGRSVGNEVRRRHRKKHHKNAPALESRSAVRSSSVWRYQLSVKAAYHRQQRIFTLTRSLNDLFVYRPLLLTCAHPRSQAPKRLTRLTSTGLLVATTPSSA
jgi:hypothetical protein